MIFPKTRGDDKEIEKEPFIVPLAIPLIAGPAVLALVMIYSRQDSNMLQDIIAIAIAWVLSTLILILSPFFSRILKEKG